ncbi:LANO_0D02674g1_1 [Lachancea nothofagi CBS 11611]|uniref:LANO_0D02674g1_1 n=1 Tax=Lachancea nothofagi CBS 11611 TaxID=1266666 RepID=A0A1G4JF25_9SACH|nr:LANO_0D02674g1_1 [Lachancea nothofagi CBS 11611]
MAESPVVLSRYDANGQFLACVTVALDKHRVSVEPTNATKSSGLMNENFLYLEDSKLRVTCLEWINISSNDSQIVALGLSSGEIWLYAPAANQIVYKLSTGGVHAVRDFKCQGEVAWCCDQSDTVYRFNMADFTLHSKFKIEGCENLQKLCVVDANHILLASHSVSLISIKTREVVKTFPGHISAVTNLVMLNAASFLTSATSDRFLNIYDLTTGGTKSVLVSQADVLQVSHNEDSVVAVVTEDGSIEIFPDPLVNTSNKRRKVVSKQSAHHLKIVRPENEKRVAAINVFVKADTLNYAWLENATIPYFDQLQWSQLSASQTIQKARPAATSKHAHRSLHGEDVAAARSYVEGNATVTSGDNFKHVEEAIAELERSGADLNVSLADRLASSSIGGDHSESKRSKKRATTGTLTVVLSQALQSHDHSLLETVLNNRDEKVIKGTIGRLQPPLAVLLLERLAERIARQTNRQGPLNVWVKWCLIIHGGYLARMPNLMSSLASLHSTLRKRAEILPRLQALETRLEFSLNQLDAYRAANAISSEETYLRDGPRNFGDEDDEEEVEYNEELDDAGLIEDGELDYDDSDENSDDSDDDNNEYQNGHGSKVKSKLDSEEHDFHDDTEMNPDVEEGYSDVEVE